jgi:methionine-rich copper-binding protein CopC
MARLLTLLLLITCAASNAAAHVRLKSSDPADGATLASAPARITLVFSAVATVTAATVQGATEDSATKLEVMPNEASTTHAVALPPLAPGDHVVTWRALSDDGHVMSGEVRFTVRAESHGEQ